MLSDNISAIHHISKTTTQITFICCSDYWESFRWTVTVGKSQSFTKSNRVRCEMLLGQEMERQKDHRW
jgi:hypothetical protein